MKQTLEDFQKLADQRLEALQMTDALQRRILDACAAEPQRRSVWKTLRPVMSIAAAALVVSIVSLGAIYAHRMLGGDEQQVPFAATAAPTKIALEPYRRASTGKYGYQSPDGNQTISESFNVAYPFDAQTGLAIVGRTQKSVLYYDVIDTRGDERTESYRYTYIGGYAEGYFIVRDRSGKYGYLATMPDPPLTLAIEAKYDAVAPFSGGHARAVLDGEEIVIDARGNALALDAEARAALPELLREPQMPEMPVAVEIP